MCPRCGPVPMAAAPLVPPTPRQQAQRRVGSVASTTLRRRVLESAALAEWSQVHEAVEVQGCSLNIQEEDSGLSLVHWAAHQGDVDTLLWLADKGAFLRLKDKRGRAPLSGATAGAFDFLLSRAYSPAERVAYARGAGGPSLELLQRELGAAEAESLVNEPLWDESSTSLAAFLASRHADGGFDCLPLLRWLAEHGANLEAMDEESNGLLHMIDWSFGATAVAPLLEWALDEVGLRHFDSRNSDGDTPSMLCAYASPSGQDALRSLRLFETAGANLALGSKKGMNVAMLLARYHGDGLWLNWCASQAGVDPRATCARRRTVEDYVALYGQEESEDE